MSAAETPTGSEAPLEEREIEDSSAKPGTKQSVLKYFGIFKDDDDAEERLADARRRREAPG